MKLMRAMATVGGLTGVSRIAGFIRDIMLAAAMGAGPISDAFFVALKLPNLFRRITAEGAFSVSFVPIYSGILSKEGEKEADIFASRALSFMFCILTVFCMLIVAIMPWVFFLIAPGFEEGSERYVYAVEMSRITFPYLLFISLTALLGGVLNAHDRFAPFAAAPIIFNLGMLSSLFFTDYFETVGHALSWGITIAGVMQLAMLYVCCRRAKIQLSIQKPRMDGNIKKLFKLMGPGILGAGVVHINLFADMFIASFLPEGSISYLYYGDRLNQLPLGVIGVAIGTALLPLLSKSVAAGREVESRHLFNRSLEVCLFLALPAGLALVFAAEPIIQVLFERGEFSHADTIVSSQVLMAYAIGLPAYIGVKVLSGAYWARQDTFSPVKIGIFVTVLNIILAIIFSRFIGVTGIALATGLMGLLQFALLYYGLRDLPLARLDDRMRMVIPRVVVAVSAMVLAIILSRWALVDWFASDSSMTRVLALGLLMAFSGGIYGLICVMSGALTLQDLKNYFKRSALQDDLKKVTE